ncbi:MAG: hypothetical protein PHO75_00820 [Candidatus Shapirobacteria bacterium]|jgi:hypothetical protein|nr:hypothetical protein [Candidatus Shapirobacteria bacterium]
MAIQIMDHEFNLFSSLESRKILKERGFFSIKLSTDTHCILVKIKDLFKIKKAISFFLLNDDGTEISNCDIEKIFREEKISCQ